MNKILLRRVTEIFYSHSSSAPALESLVNFFRSDVTFNAKGWIEFISEPKFDITTSNVSCVEKEGDYITVGDEWHYDDDPRVDATTMLISDFVIMLERWDELYKQKPDEIIITQDDNGKISMVGKFNDGREI